jgi:hypothetical protein
MPPPTSHSSGGDRQFVMQGWAILGSLKSGWNTDIQQNYNDMHVKLKQIGLRSLLPPSQAEPVLYPDDFFYSQGTYDFMQLLTTVGGVSSSGELEDFRIVAYSIWMSAQGWAGFSPFPLVSYNKDGEKPPAYVLYPVDQETDEQATHITGWCVGGSFGTEWYKDLKGNYDAAFATRREFGLSEATPLYWTQRQDLQCLQVLQAPEEVNPAPGTSITNNSSALIRYLNWFASRGFGSLWAQPFMSGNMIGEANSLAGHVP